MTAAAMQFISCGICMAFDEKKEILESCPGGHIICQECRIKQCSFGNRKCPYCPAHFPDKPPMYNWTF